MKGRGKKGSKVKRTAGEIRQPIRERGHGPNLFPGWDVFFSSFSSVRTLDDSVVGRSQISRGHRKNSARSPRALTQFVDHVEEHKV